MNLPPAPEKYERADQQASREAIRSEDLRNVKSDAAVEFLLIRDADTAETGKLTINSGVITWTAL